MDNQEIFYGAQIGLQKQWSNTVLGMEFSVFDAIDDDDYAQRPTFSNNAGLLSMSRLGSMYTIGGRVGWSVNDTWLLYASGGYARVSLTTAARNPATGQDAFASTDKHDAWYIGTGIDYAVSEFTSIGFEYRYIDVDTAQHCPNPSCAAGAAVFNNRDVSAGIDTFRVHFDYKMWGANNPLK